MHIWVPLPYSIEVHLIGHKPRVSAISRRLPGCSVCADPEVLDCCRKDGPSNWHVRSKAKHGLLDNPQFSNLVMFVSWSTHQNVTTTRNNGMDVSWYILLTNHRGLFSNLVQRHQAALFGSTMIYGLHGNMT